MFKAQSLTKKLKSTIMNRAAKNGLTMDPTKNFDHLDPKLKETYARVMGTTPAGTGNTTQNTPQAANPAPVATPPADPSVQAQNQFTAAPLDQPLSPVSNPNMGPNPGTGPTINSIPTDTSTLVAQPQTTSAATPDTNAPSTSSFFSNPSPATTDPAQNPVQAGSDNLSAPITPVTEPPSAPVTPYTPENQSQYVPPAQEAAAQPLPSPSTVTQKAPRETSALLRVLYIVAAAIFFAIYTVFWIKVFNLPFLF